MVARKELKALRAREGFVALVTFGMEWTQKFDSCFDQSFR